MLADHGLNAPNRSFQLESFVMRQPLRALPAALLLFGLTAPISAQDPSESLKVTRLVVEPAKIQLEAGATTKVKVLAYDAQNALVHAPLRVGGSRNVQVSNLVCVAGSGCTVDLKATAQGVFRVPAFVVLPATENRQPLNTMLEVSVVWPAVSRITVATPAKKLYPGTTLSHGATAFHANNTMRPGAVFRWSSSDPAIASVD